MSALELSDCTFVLLSPAVSWVTAARIIAQDVRAPLASYCVGSSAGCDLLADHEDFRELYGLGETGAALVRPDGHVAWRCASAATSTVDEQAAELRRAMEAVLSWEGPARHLVRSRL